nr:GNAT family N-acetyltransferase [Frankia torreyi]
MHSRTDDVGRAAKPRCSRHGRSKRSPRPGSGRENRRVRIRTGRDGDVELLLAFWQSAAHGTSVSDDAAGVAALLAHDPQAVLVAEVDGTVVGTLIAGWDGWRCHLYRLAVAPEHRRAGVARALLAAARERFLALGGRRIDAMVDDTNTRAHALYRAADYRSQSSWTRWVHPLG